MALNIKALKELDRELLEVSLKKHSDYSSKVDAIEACGIDGLITRIFDKACRMLSLKSKGYVGEVEEKLEETAKDLINYTKYLVLLIREEWKEEETTPGGASYAQSAVASPGRGFLNACPAVEDIYPIG